MTEKMGEESEKPESGGAKHPKQRVGKVNKQKKHKCGGGSTKKRDGK